MKQDTTRIVLVDDHEVVRRGVRALVETEPGYVICGESDNGRTAIELAKELRPDVLIIDVSLPGWRRPGASCKADSVARS